MSDLRSCRSYLSCRSERSGSGLYEGLARRSLVRSSLLLPCRRGELLARLRRSGLYLLWSLAILLSGYVLHFSHCSTQESQGFSNVRSQFDNMAICILSSPQQLFYMVICTCARSTILFTCNTTTVINNLFSWYALPSHLPLKVKCCHPHQLCRCYLLCQ